jgi:aminopeptidase O
VCFYFHKIIQESILPVLFLSATFLYEMNIPLPCSTLALAIGWFECRQTSTVALSSTIPCRVFSAPSVINEASEELLPRCTKYVTTACELLGPYPFTRVDLVILPRCFACMGLMRCVLGY